MLILSKCGQQQYLYDNKTTKYINNKTLNNVLNSYTFDIVKLQYLFIE